MAIIPDCSSLLCLAFDDEDVVYGTSVLEAVQKDGGVVPSIFWFEIRNGLIANERRQRITVADSITFLSLLSQLPIVIEPLPSDAGVIEIARQHQLSVYDAAYVDLALREGSPLASLDEKMKKVARAVGVQVWPTEC